ncbi:MAG: MBL fold metallo-hydrolase [Lachnospiraceae bacterium]|nr:MBL fold metallo-hydrolase [Lachnospiraceae bacterium]
MKVTYLNHSGFLLEWEHCYWIFDYYQGEIPRLDRQKTVFVFCSHSHGDHFNPAIFALAEEYPSVKYVFSSQVRPSCRKFDRNLQGVHLSEKQIVQVCGRRWEPDGTQSRLIPLPEITFLASRTAAEIADGYGESLQIFALRSTDCGCAFLINYEGKTIYHAGDLHWWNWPGETEKNNRQMTANFKKEMEYLAGKRIDLAFAPLDARLEENYGLGLEYLLEHAQVSHVFPMHFWNEYSVMDRYAAEYPLPKETQFYRIDRDGQSWEIAL